MLIFWNPPWLPFALSNTSCDLSLTISTISSLPQSLPLSIFPRILCWFSNKRIVMLPQVFALVLLSLEDICDRYGIIPNFLKIFVQMPACHRGLYRQLWTYTHTHHYQQHHSLHPLPWFFSNTFFTIWYVLDTYIHIVFIFHKFYICKFTRSLKYSYNLKPRTCGVVFKVIYRHVQSCEKFGTQRHILIWGWTLSFLFISHIVNKCPFCSIYCAMFFPFFMFLVVIYLFKTVPSVVLKCFLVFLNERKLCCALQRKCVLDEPCSGMSYYAFGCKLNVSESTESIKQGVFKQKHI